MPRIWIGVHVHAEPQRLQATLASLRAHTGPAFAPLLLPDSPDAATTAALTALRALPQSGTVTPRGVAACFNRLAVAALGRWRRRPGAAGERRAGWAGLARPPPRRARRRPAQRPGRSLHERRLERTGGLPPHQRGARRPGAHRPEAARRFGDTTRTLEPLHSLSDFCYVVRREVVEAIGAADEGYGLGHAGRWTTTSARRAPVSGGVWVRGAYVHRAPFTARRRREEARVSTRARRAIRTSSARCGCAATASGYEPHCRGDACEHFAPTSADPGYDRCRPRHRLPTAPAPRPDPPAAMTSPPAQPLISCVMPTGGRPDFARQAIALLPAPGVGRARTDHR